MWDYYLIYAKIFGIADSVRKQFSDIYPNIIDIFDDLTVNVSVDKDGYVSIS